MVAEEVRQYVRDLYAEPLGFGDNRDDGNCSSEFLLSLLIRSARGPPNPVSIPVRALPNLHLHIHIA
jgi:hypothetical protein